MMKPPLEIVEDILKNSGLAETMDENEMKQAIFLLGTDLNQFILEKLFTQMNDEDISKVDAMMKDDDQVGIQEVFDALGERKEVGQIIEEAIADYARNITGDLKNIKRALKKKK